MIVITGATGDVGRSLVALLAGEGAEVRAVTRTPPAADLPAPVEVVAGDPSKPETMTAALSGASALFLHSRAVNDAASDLVALARELGVRRVVALAAANVDDDFAYQPSRYRGDRNKEVEAAAVGSGLGWVSLRPSTFAGNALSAWGDQIRAGDVVRYVYAGFQESPLDERDLAEVAARALLSDDLVGQRVELTGPQSLSHEQMVAVLGDVLGRPLRYQEIPPEAAKHGMLQHGLPAPFVEALMARYAAHLEQPQHPPTPEVEKILGRPARTYAEWVTDHALAFATGGNG
jgi:uncharacterized protein YbjT (DUF2867 family)